MQDQEISIFPEERIVYATFGQRFAAAFLDLLVLATPVSIITSALGNHMYVLEVWTGHPTTEGKIANLLNILLWLVYCAAMESSKSQATIGKMALKLKVTDLDGNRISFLKAAVRYLACILSKIIIFIGYFMVLWDGRKQSLHDKIAGTLVVRTQK